MKRTSLLLCCLCLLFTACGKSDDASGDENTRPTSARGVPNDVLLYHEDADAKKIGYEATSTGIVLIMETINGPLSPITYYRNIESKGWKIIQDVTNEGGVLLATKKKRELEITFEAMPGGAGTIITLRTTKED